MTSSRSCIHIPFFVVFFLLGFFSLVSCIPEQEIRATGRLQDIVLVGANSLDSAAIDALTKKLEGAKKWVLEENIFNIKPVSADDLNLFKYRRNIVIAGIPGSNEVISQIFYPFFQGEAGERFRRDGRVAFFIDDLWADNQTVYFFAGRNRNELARVIEEKGDDSFALFMHRMMQGMSERVYMAGLNHEEMKRIARKYPWRIKIPAGYRLRFDRDFGDGHITGWWSRDPDLQIFIYREESEKPFVSAASVATLRDTLASRFYEGDLIVRESMSSEKTTFSGKFESISIEGAWSNSRYMVGGSFKSYAFTDFSSIPPSRYLVDIAVFAPGEEKDPLMRKLMAIVETFSLEPGR